MWSHSDGGDLQLVHVYNHLLNHTGSPDSAIHCACSLAEPKTDAAPGMETPSAVVEEEPLEVQLLGELEEALTAASADPEPQQPEPSAATELPSLETPEPQRGTGAVAAGAEAKAHGEQAAEADTAIQSGAAVVLSAEAEPPAGVSLPGTEGALDLAVSEEAVPDLPTMAGQTADLHAEADPSTADAGTAMVTEVASGPEDGQTANLHAEAAPESADLVPEPGSLAQLEDPELAALTFSPEAVQQDSAEMGEIQGAGLVEDQLPDDQLFAEAGALDGMVPGLQFNEEEDDAGGDALPFEEPAELKAEVKAEPAEEQSVAEPSVKVGPASVTQLGACDPLGWDGLLCCADHARQVSMLEHLERFMPAFLH